MLSQIPISSSELQRSLVHLIRGHERLSLQVLLCATSTQSCRFQSSLRSTTRSSTDHARPRLQRPVVNPSLRQRRPIVNGQPVAFHVQDLMPPAKPAVTYTSLDRLDSQHQSRKSHLLKQRSYESDLVVVLDMDECLIHSQFLSNPTMAQVLAHQLQNRRRSNRSTGNNSANPSEVDHFRVQLPEDGELVHVNIRPGLEQFLDDITSRYETHIFTAAMPIYANPVLDQFDPDGTKFAARWFREHCTYDASRKAFVKNLNTLPLPNLARSVLIDNNPLSFLSHPSNGILVPSFYNDPEDNTLTAVKQLLTELEPLDDVRPVLEERFGLKNALKQLLPNSSETTSVSAISKSL